MNLFQIGDEIRCACDQTCFVRGKVLRIDIPRQEYLIELNESDRYHVTFSNAALVSKLERAMK
jgi:hypothetical protein